MRTSKRLLATLKEVPADAEIISHQLMLRAGLIRRTAAGIYSWLPVGKRVLNKVEGIVREEMDRSGAQEVLMPGVHPPSFGRHRDVGKSTDPNCCVSRTGTNAISASAPPMKRSSRNWRKTRFAAIASCPPTFTRYRRNSRDEIRPRFGIMRAREFIMKDAYSFNIDFESLLESYQEMYDAYVRIFDRIGLEYRAVVADNGSIGGEGSHEFHVLASSGEDAIVFSDQGPYAANLEKAETVAPRAAAEPSETMRLVDTPEYQDHQGSGGKLSSCPSKKPSRPWWWRPRKTAAMTWSLCWFAVTMN